MEEVEGGPRDEREGTTKHGPLKRCKYSITTLNTLAVRLSTHKETTHDYLPA